MTDVLVTVLVTVVVNAVIWSALRWALPDQRTVDTGWKWTPVLPEQRPTPMEHRSVTIYDEVTERLGFDPLVGLPERPTEVIPGIGERGDLGLAGPDQSTGGQVNESDGGRPAGKHDDWCWEDLQSEPPTQANDHESEETDGTGQPASGGDQGSWARLGSLAYLGPPRGPFSLCHSVRLT